MSSIFGSLFRSPNVFKNTFNVSKMNLNTKTTKHLTDLVAEHPDLDFPERRYLLPPVLKGYPWNPDFITGVTGLLLHNLYQDINLYYSANSPSESESESLLFFNKHVYRSMGPILSKRLTSISINFMGIIASQFDFIIVSTIHMILENRYKLYQAANSKTHEQLIRVTAAEIAIVLTTPTTVLLNLVYPTLSRSESEWIRQYMAESPGFKGGFEKRVTQYDNLLREYEPGIVVSLSGGKRKNRTYRRKRTNNSRKNR